MINQATPRQVLTEIRKAKRKPWWADRLFDRITAHLTIATYNGQPIIDQMMSEKACAAVLEEALNVVQMPGNDPVDDMLNDVSKSHFLSRGVH